MVVRFEMVGWAEVAKAKRRGIREVLRRSMVGSLWAIWSDRFWIRVLSREELVASSVEEEDYICFGLFTGSERRVVAKIQMSMK